MRTISIYLFCLSLWMLAFGCGGKENRQEQATTAKQQELQADTVFASWTDSMEWVAAAGSEEEKLKALSELTLYYQAKDIPRSLSYAWKQKELATAGNHIIWLGDAYENMGYIYFYEQHIDSTQYYFEAAHSIWSEIGTKLELAVSNSNLSLAHRLKSQPDSAIFYLQKALAMLKEIKDELRVSKTLADIASIYNDMGNDQKHDEYALKALSMQEHLEDNVSLGITLINLCLSMQSQGRFGEAIEYGERSLKAFREADEPFFVCTALIRVGGVLSQANETTRAMNYMTEAAQIADELGNQQMKTEALRLRSNYYMNSEDFQKAKSDMETALALTDTANKKELVYIYYFLTKASIHMGNKEEAAKYLSQYANIKNELHNQNWIDKVSELEIKYETEKKELKISALEAQKRWMMWLSIAGSVVLLLALTVFFFLWRWTVQKKRLAETQIKQFEQEKQLVATQSILDGETRERTRLARDLHDGLGSMLTGIRLNLQEMKSGAIMVYADVERFDKALELLDESVREMRRVSHHLMPDSLSRFGLKPAVDDFCRNFSSAVTFDYFGDETRLDPKLEVVIYRCIHELVNNAMKHSGASQIMVQIMQEPDRIAFTVQDDGCGFDLSAETKGTGLQNIRTRIASFGGNFQIDSQKNRGTEVNAEFQLKVTNYK